MDATSPDLSESVNDLIVLQKRQIDNLTERLQLQTSEVEALREALRMFCPNHILLKDLEKCDPSKKTGG